MTRTNEVGETRVVGAVPATDAQPVYPHTMRLQRFLARAGVVLKFALCDGVMYMLDANAARKT